MFIAKYLRGISVTLFIFRILMVQNTHNIEHNVQIDVCGIKIKIYFLFFKCMPARVNI